MATDENLRTEIENAMQQLGLPPEDSVDAIECIIFLREHLAQAIKELDKKNLPRSIAIAGDLDAIAAVDEITDRVVKQQGLLEKAFQGEDIHDALAEIKAKIESLIVGEIVKARTIEHIKSATQQLKQMERDKDG